MGCRWERQGIRHAELVEAPQVKGRSHFRSNEQVYVIVRGRGVMKVGEEEQEVGPGTLVFIPPGTGHAIRNTGDEPLVYLSATAPPFDLPPASSTFAYAPRNHSRSRELDANG